MKAHNGPVQCGDVFVFPGLPDDCPLSFGIINYHPDNKGDLCYPNSEDLFLLVPIGPYCQPLVGVHDVFERASDVIDSCILMCGYSFWVSRADLKEEYRVSYLSDSSQRKCKKKISQMARGIPVHGSQAQWEAEANPDYQKWDDEVNHWVYNLQERFR